jgi:hypothetical protein
VLQAAVGDRQDIRTFANVRAVMARHPGMKFRVMVPLDVTVADRHEFEQMGVKRV